MRRVYTYLREFEECVGSLRACCLKASASLTPLPCSPPRHRLPDHYMRFSVSVLVASVLVTLGSAKSLRHILPPLADLKPRGDLGPSLTK